jgi:hypothetical protein
VNSICDCHWATAARVICFQVIADHSLMLTVLSMPIF